MFSFSSCASACPVWNFTVLLSLLVFLFLLGEIPSVQLGQLLVLCEQSGTRKFPFAKEANVPGNCWK